MKKINLLLVHLAGLAALSYPFITGKLGTHGPAFGRSQDAPWFFAILACLLLVSAWMESTRDDFTAKKFAMLGVLIGTAAILRLPISFAGANLFFVIPILGGFVFGSTFGFLLGAMGMAASALVTAGLGPWLPFQMFAAGWVGMGAGIFGTLTKRFSERIKVVTASTYGGMAAFLYGIAINLFFWPSLARGDASIGWLPSLSPSEAVVHYTNFYMITSAVWDSFGAITNIVIILIVGRPVIALFERMRRKTTLTFVNETQPLENYLITR